MSSTGEKKQDHSRRKEIRLGGVRIDLIGPDYLARNEEAKDAAIDLLRTWPRPPR